MSSFFFNDLRLKNQIEKEKRYAKKELGIFCKQYGFDPLIAPSRNKRKEKKDVDIYKTNNRRYNKSRSKEKREDSKRKKRDRYRENDIVCFKNVVKRDTLVDTITFKER